MQRCSLLHEHVDNHSCTRFLKGNVDNEPLTNPHEVNAEGQFWGLEKVHSVLTICLSSYMCMSLYEKQENLLARR
jgi:hypothetical protein